MTSFEVQKGPRITDQSLSVFQEYSMQMVATNGQLEAAVRMLDHFTFALSKHSLEPAGIVFSVCAGLNGE